MEDAKYVNGFKNILYFVHFLFILMLHV